MIFRTDVFHDRELPGRSCVDGVSLDRTVDLRAEILSRVQNQTQQTSPPNGQEQGKGKKKIRIRTFLNEAIFIASAFFGAAYRFPFFVVEEDEAGRVAFCFEVFITFTLP